MRKSSLAIAIVVYLSVSADPSAASGFTVDFDDRAGKPGPFSGACPAENQVHDEYLGLGVRFESNDAAVCVLEPGAGAPSPPNVATGVTGGNIDFSAPVVASFHLGGVPETVTSVSVTLTSSSSSTTTVEAYDLNGVLLGSSGFTGPGTHIVAFNKKIHSVRVDNGAFAFDDFTFSDPAAPPVPALSPFAGFLLTLLLAGAALRALSGSGSGRATGSGV